MQGGKPNDKDGKKRHNEVDALGFGAMVVQLFHRFVCARWAWSDRDADIRQHGEKPLPIARALSLGGVARVTHRDLSSRSGTQAAFLVV